ncbi:MAG: hypothetical protein JSV37_05120 [Anaerolineaceae bacterium]|nr:MAG: hypothetical protein JSV37_05120 [Anaerolineaceae bacterium]
MAVGCNTPTPTAPEPTDEPPTPSPIAATPTATLDVTATPEPLTAATPAIVVESTYVPYTATGVPPAVSLPMEKLRIYQPGPGSQVVSPFRVAGWGGPSYKDRVRMRLYGEDGRVLAEGTTWLHVLEGVAQAGRFYGEVPFEIHGVAEAGRLEISMYGYRYGQLSHLSTVDLTLLSVGNPQIHHALDGPEKLTIFSLREESIVEGGRVNVQGAGWVNSDLPLTVQVFDRYGEVLGSGQVYLEAPTVGQLGTFQVEVPYEITFSQWARVAVSEHSADIPGLIHFTSVEVWLKP